jgi:pimeloyl-ACP methyl ester carboxylesterase
MITTRIAAGPLNVALHEQAARSHNRTDRVRPVLYIHGGTFPASLAVFWQFDGISWADSLAAAGHHVFGLDMPGFGASDRYYEMGGDRMAAEPRGGAVDALQSIDAAVDHIRARLGVERVHLVAHSWGTMAAALYATRYPAKIGRLALFAPITARGAPRDEDAAAPAWHLLSAKAQWDRFSGSVPAGENGGMPRRWFEPWGAAYMASDPQSHAHDPHAVKIPGGPVRDLARAAAGWLPYDPAEVTAPTLIVRGEWDHWPTDDDARWLFGALKNAHPRRDVKIARGTHLMHLEPSRFALFREVECFLQGGDEEPPAA